MKSNKQYNRHYSIKSLILIFFVFSFIGWLWEVLFHLIGDGVFVNRGMMYGPWLPIYGGGSILILVLLKKYRTRPILEFFLIIILCGIVEYFSSYLLEVIYHQKWWDYSEYLLNINGRVCASGLILFGIGGMLAIYYAAPYLDNLISKINSKVLTVACAILCCLFVGDAIYSAKHPNSGKGINDYKMVE